MNYYLLFLSLYTLCIFPSGLWVELRLGKGMTYSLRLGLPWLGPGKKGGLGERAWRKGIKELGQEDDPQEDLGKSLLGISPALLRALLSREVWRSARRLLDRGKIWLYVRCAFPDAAATALTYASVNTLLEFLRRKGLGRLDLDAKTELSFEGEGSYVAVRGIFILRLGSIALLTAYVTLRTIRIMVRHRAREKEKNGFHLKEGQYATSHR
ncbi:MAG: hypothetical protein VB099_07630 [Candidatus Limiplasma sp.]|nr:hypothetical protein [Candidatus Limiplasma sp.]